jgi:ParB family chromosome partitioning protein
VRVRVSPPAQETSIFWIETDKIIPNPYQPRREFDQDRLKELADSIRQYGVLQPLVVSRKETDGRRQHQGGIRAHCRRTPLARIQACGVMQIPVVVRTGDDDRAKLELAIIENLQREDLNAVERAQSFQRLADEFKLTWADVGRKDGEEPRIRIQHCSHPHASAGYFGCLSKGQISEGHTRPLLMLIDRPQEQMTLFKEMMVRKMTVREAEQIARRIAFEKVRKKDHFMTPEVVDMEEKLAETLGYARADRTARTRRTHLYDYFSHEDFSRFPWQSEKQGKQRRTRDVRQIKGRGHADAQRAISFSTLHPASDGRRVDAS